MNKVFVTGNLTHDPELRTLQSGDAVCNFTIAVNRRRRNNAEAGKPDADFFRVTAWRQLGENCAKWLIKGKKVGVTGSISASAYMGSDGKPHANLDINADEVEFLSPANTAEEKPPVHNTPAPVRVDRDSGFVQVDGEDLPF